MKKALILIILFYWIFSPFMAIAQVEWIWGRQCTTTSVSNGIDVAASAMDTFGNVFTANYVGDSANTFGPYTIVDSLNVHQSVITKTDSSGNFLWAIGTQHSGAFANSLTTDPTGNLYFLCGYDSSYCRFGGFTLYNPPKVIRPFLAKISPSGTVLWAKNIGTCGHGNVVMLDNAGNIYIAGGFSLPTDTIGTIVLTNTSTSHTEDIFIVKLDTVGNAIWAKSYGTPGFDYIYAATVSDNGNLFISGSYGFPSFTIGTTTLSTTYYDPAALSYEGSYFAKFDSSGNSRWLHSIDRHVTISEFIANGESSLYMTGSIDSVAMIDTIALTSAGSSDIFIARFDSAGHSKWAKGAGGVAGEGGRTISMGSCSQLVVCGQMSPYSPYPTSFSGFDLYSPHSSPDPSFIAIYDTAGLFHSAVAISSGSDDYVGAHADKNGNFYVVADYWIDSLIFGHDTLRHTGSTELLLIAKYRYDTAGCPPSPLAVEQFSAGQDINIFPNPTENVLTVCASVIISTITITNLLGQTVYAHEYNTEKVQVDVADLPAGMYLVRINGTEVRKFVKE